MEPAFSRVMQLGGCAVELRLASLEVAWDEFLSGELRLTSDGSDHQFSRLAVILSGPPDGPVVGRESALVMDSARFGPVSVPSRRELVLPFTLQMGWGLGFSSPAELTLRAQVEHAEGNQFMVPIKVLPPPEFALLAELAGQEAQLTGGEWSSIDAGDGAVVSFKANEQTGGAFDSLILRLYRNSGVVYGVMQFEPRALSFRDRVTALAGLRVKEHQLRLPSDDREAAQEYFREALRSYVNAVRELPIPANRGTSHPDELPRPSDGP